MRKSADISSKQKNSERPYPDLKVIFAAELFSKLPKDKQVIVIEQIKALLLHE